MNNSIQSIFSTNRRTLRKFPETSETVLLIYKYSSLQKGLNMIITTTHSVEGKVIERYLGVISGEAIVGANIFRDIFAGIRDIVGGRSQSYEKELRTAREIAMREMENQACHMGANAIVGVDIDYEVLGSSNGMLMVSVNGTAVKTNG